jgi:transcriptional regulator with XRE-family HTH domain
MASNTRRKPKNLASKLQKVRNGLGLSQTEMVKLLGLPDRAKVSAYELGKREPDLPTLLAYVRAVEGLTVEHLIDDDIKLPEILPAAKPAKMPSRKKR